MSGPGWRVCGAGCLQFLLASGPDAGRSGAELLVQHIKKRDVPIWEDVASGIAAGFGDAAEQCASRVSGQLCPGWRSIIVLKQRRTPPAMGPPAAGLVAREGLAGWGLFSVAWGAEELWGLGVVRGVRVGSAVGVRELFAAGGDVRGWGDVDGFAVVVEESGGEVFEADA